MDFAEDLEAIRARIGEKGLELNPPLSEQLHALQGTYPERTESNQATGKGW